MAKPIEPLWAVVARLMGAEGYTQSQIEKASKHGADYALSDEGQAAIQADMSRNTQASNEIELICREKYSTLKIAGQRRDIALKAMARAW